MQVTVSGVMATWCYVKSEADNCCSAALSSSLFRSMTYSFGSICFGSLVQAIVSLLRFMLENARNTRENEERGGCATLMLCILECIAKVSSVEGILQFLYECVFLTKSFSSLPSCWRTL